MMWIIWSNGTNNMSTTKACDPLLNKKKRKKKDM